MAGNHLSEILITGGTGLLGNTVCDLFEQHRNPYTVSTHRRCALKDNMVFMDMATGEGIREAVAGKKVILHLASDKKNPDNDISGIQTILSELKNLEQKTHLVYISIVGTDCVSLPYFKQKWQVEQVIMKSSQAYTILRATQFHPYMETVLRQLLRWPVGILPKKILLQPIDVKPVAAALFELAYKQPANQTILLGGPQALHLGDAAKSWLAMRNKKKFIINLPLWGSTGKNLRAGALTCRQRVTGSPNWEEWLHKG